jgi:hypothetical protein
MSLWDTAKPLFQQYLGAEVLFFYSNAYKKVVQSKIAPLNGVVLK